LEEKASQFKPNGGSAATLAKAKRALGTFFNPQSAIRNPQFLLASRMNRSNY
jgi:hypothetical protein